MIGGPAAPAPKQAIFGVSQHESAGQPCGSRLCLSPGTPMLIAQRQFCYRRRLYQPRDLPQTVRHPPLVFSSWLPT